MDECFIATDELIKLFTLPTLCKTLKDRVRVTPTRLTFDYIYTHKCSLIGSTPHIVSVIQPPSSDDLVVRAYNPSTCGDVRLSLNDGMIWDVVSKIRDMTTDITHRHDAFTRQELSQSICIHSNSLFAIIGGALTLKQARIREEHAIAQSALKQKRLEKVGFDS